MAPYSIIRLEYLFRSGRFNIAIVHGHVKHSCVKVENFPACMCTSRANGRVHAPRECAYTRTYACVRAYVDTDSVFNSRALSQGVIVLGPLPHQPSSTTDLSRFLPMLYAASPVCSISDLLQLSGGTPLRYHNIRANENGRVPRDVITILVEAGNGN